MTYITSYTVALAPALIILYNIVSGPCCITFIMSEEKTAIIEQVKDSARRGAIEADGTSTELTPFEDNTSYPWERQPGEKNFWYDIFFRYYVLLGPGRNLARAYRAYAKAEEGFDATGYSVNPRWHHMALGWHWKIRAEAFDEFQRMRDAETWEKRRRELREKEWDVSSQLLNVAEDALEALAPQDPSPQASNKGTSGRVQSRTVKPGDVTRFAETGSKLGRLASGMATDQTQHVNIHARMEEVRKQRWDNVAPLLEEVIDGEYEFKDDQEHAGKDVMAGEAVSEPPKGQNEQAGNDS